MLNTAHLCQVGVCRAWPSILDGGTKSLQLGVHLKVAAKVVHSDEGLQLLGEQRLQLLCCVLFAPLLDKTASGAGLRMSSLCVVRVSG